MAAERHILRAVMQTCAPLIIDSGDSDAMSDTDPVRDANGLPLLPATTLAGALRAAVGEKADEWFGWQKGDEGERSVVTLTDGLFHWSDDRPRDGLVLDAKSVNADPLCRAVLPGTRPLTRQHVRLTEHGVGDDHGKFSRDALPAGARFTFELRTRNGAAVRELKRKIEAGLFLGGATRAGYGALQCHQIGVESIMDITGPEGWNRWCRIMGAKLDEDRGIRMAAPAPPEASAPVWKVTGQIDGPLLIGSDKVDGDEDRAPWRESRIVWDDLPGKLGAPVHIIPGSALKGPVRHRVLYHLHKAGVTEAEAVVDAMFGSASKDDSGAAGRLRFHDCQIPENTASITQTHVGLDRFTGGARRGVLFTDKMLWQPQLDIHITELQPLTEAQQRVALRSALDDLACGLLGIGAEWGEGAGVFSNATVTQPPTEESADEV